MNLICQKKIWLPWLVSHIFKNLHRIVKIENNLAELETRIPSTKVFFKLDFDPSKHDFKRAGLVSLYA